MKKKLRLCLWIVLIVVLSIGGISVVLVSLRNRTLSQRTAPTLAELEQLATRPDGVAREDDIGRGEDPDGNDIDSESTAENVEASNSGLPTSLAISATPEMRSSEFVETRAEMFLELRFQALSFQVIEAAVSLFSEEEAARLACTTAFDKMRLGKWDSARRYFWQVLDSDADPKLKGYVCAKLAWLEEDPEKAALLLELACETDDDHSLASAIELCRATDSVALADHYLARLREIDPGWARQYDPGYEPRPNLQ